jgi:predicted ATP-grasp superfamily ATP-dependent carboligase
VASVADGAIFERRGVPAAAIITHTFTRAADAMARIYGYPDYRYVAIRHPISSLNAEQIRQRAAEAMPGVLSILGLENGTGPAAVGS